MDEGVQAADQGGNEGLIGGTAQPREVAKGKPGRRKTIRPVTPELARELAVTIRHFLPELAVWLGIENAGGVYVKQDCEKKAFHRLERRLRTLFPQTPFWLLLDALYADQHIMRPCFDHGWNFCISFLDTDMPALWKEAQALLALSPGQRTSMTLPHKEGSREVRWINDLDYAGMSLGVIFQTDRDDQRQIERIRNRYGSISHKERP